MKSIELNIEKALGTVSKSDVFALEDKAKSGMEMLHKGTGKGNDFLGWLHLPSEITEAHLADLEAAAKQLKDRCEIVVVTGIGGSYLGAKAVIEALSDSFEFLRSEHKNPLVLFAGHNIGEDYLFELQTLLKNKSFGIVVISKSGTTTEPAIAFRLLKEQLEAQVGKDEAKHRIIATALVETGSRMDDIVYEEFKGTGNMEIHLDRKLSEKRIFPAIDLNKSGTRREDLLLSKEELECAFNIRKLLSSANTSDATDQLLSLMSKTTTNQDFIKRMRDWMNLYERQGYTFGSQTGNRFDK